MSDIAVSVEALSKAYMLPAYRAQRTLRARLSRHLREYIGSVRRAHETDLFWALKDVSFEVRRGDALGIVGKNGSGKSTLLKILAGVVQPTEGRAVLRGRVGSLLEVGTGFHPDLTGRQNVYLSGMLLGMRKEQVRKRFDEIVYFSGIGEFIDVPVKRYSSGMFVRLAYSVASNLDTDILMLDEVLAVGDAEFTERSKRNIEKVVHDGRTILFVSHSMPAVSDMCQQGMVLSQGRMTFHGSASDAVSTYMKMIHKLSDQARDFDSGPAEVDLRQAPGWDGKRDVVITSVATLKNDGTPTRLFTTGDGVRIRIGYSVTRETRPYFTIFFIAPTGERAMTVYSNHCSEGLELRGDGFVECVIPELRLAAGDFSLTLDFGRDGEPVLSVDCVPDATVIRVQLGDYLRGFGLAANQGWIAQQTFWSKAEPAGLALDKARPVRAR